MIPLLVIFLLKMPEFKVKLYLGDILKDCWLVTYKSCQSHGNETEEEADKQSMKTESDH